MVKFVSFAGILAIASIMLSGTAMAADVEIALEAELADNIQAPMATGVPADAKARGGQEPDEPSNGKFIWSSSGSGFAEFIIDIPEKDTYAIWGRIVSWDGSSDSFWVTWEPADAAENPQQTQNMDRRWATAQGPTWHWDRIEAWKADDSHEDREWELDKGETKLTIWSRESNTMLDCLYITNDIAGGEANKRVPTDQDRELQIHGASGRAVEAAGKLSTTWGKIKKMSG